MKHRFLVLSSLLLALVSRGFSETIIAGGIYPGNLYWDLAGSPYIVTGTMKFYGSAAPQLNIDPGVEVRFHSGARLEIAHSGNGNGDNYRGGINAVGNALEPIVFTADNDLAGGWGGIHIYNSADHFTSSTIEFCRIEKATTNLSMYRTTQPDLLLNVEILDATADGLVLSQCPITPVLQNLMINDNSGYPLLLSGSGLPDFNNVTISGNGVNRIAYSGLIIEDTILDIANFGADLLFTGNTRVYGSGSPRLSITAGSELRFAAGASMQIGHSANLAGNNYRGELFAQGTAIDPILFTADSDISGGWNGLQFYNSADHDSSESVLEHSIIEKATTNLGLYRTAQPDTLYNLHLRDASASGLLISQCPDPSFIKDLTITDNADYALLLSGSGLPGYDNLSLSGNGNSRIGYTGLIIEDTVLDIAGYPGELLFFGNTKVYNAANPRLSITAGSELRFANGATIQIAHPINSAGNSYRGELFAQGTALDPIIFTADDDLPGGWGGLHFYNSTDHNGAESSIEHCIIEKATSNLNLYKTAQPDTLQSLQLLDASINGLQLSQSPVPCVLQDLSITNCAEYPILLNGAGLPVYNNLSMSGNGSSRIGYTGTIIEDTALDIVAYPIDILFYGNTKVYSSANPRLTISAGSELRFADGASLQIGNSINSTGNSYRGELFAQGTAIDPISFSADNGLSGGWDGLHFYNSADYSGAESALEHCIIEKATTNLSLYRTAQPDTLQSLQLRDASLNGLQLSQSPVPSVLQDLTITNNLQYPVVLNGSGLPVLNNLALSGNGFSQFGYTGTVIDDTVLDIANYPQAVLFYANTGVYSSSNPRLTISAGSELRFANSASLQIGHPINAEGNSYRGGLFALGSSTEIISFVADTGDIGAWDGIYFYDSADYSGAESQLNYCTVTHAVGGVVLNNTDQPRMENVNSIQNLNNGLKLIESYPVVRNCSFLDNSIGVYISNNLQTTIGDSVDWACSFNQNSDWELYNDGIGDVMARYNHWCPPEGQTMSQLIYDQLDDPAKGLVYYQPSIPGTTMRLTIEYLPLGSEVHLEWCPFAGAIEYKIFRSADGYWDSSTDIPIATLSTTSYNLPVPAGSVEVGYFKIVAVLP
jgi:hypothetical protein